MSATTHQRVALIIIDMQQGMATEEAGERNNPQAEANIQRLLTVWRHRDEHVVHVRLPDARHMFAALPSSPICCERNTFPVPCEPQLPL